MPALHCLHKLIILCMFVTCGTVFSEEEAGISKFRIRTGSKLQPVIQFQVLLPTEVQTKPRCCYYVTWRADETYVREQMLDSTSGVVQFARSHGLALISWDARHLRVPGGSDADMSSELDLVCDAWSNGVNTLAEKLNIEPTNGFGYGVSRGATYIQGLIKRSPKYFAAAHLHEGGFFEVPGSPGSLPFVLITTGEYDNNDDACLQYFLLLQELGSFPSFKSFKGLGHAESLGTDALQSFYFDHVASLLEKAHGNRKEAQKLHAESLLSSQVVVGLSHPAARASVAADKADKRKYQILPNEEFARKWEEVDDLSERPNKPIGTSNAFINGK